MPKRNVVILSDNTKITVNHTIHNRKVNMLLECGKCTNYKHMLSVYMYVHTYINTLHISHSKNCTVKSKTLIKHNYASSAEDICFETLYNFEKILHPNLLKL